MKNSDFVDWIQHNLDERGWKRVELTRVGGINSGYVSQVINREKLPGLDFCKGIARAFNMRDVDVLRIAGLIDDSQGVFDADVISAAMMLQELSEDDREEINAIIRVKHERHRKK